jgi:nicotinate-nucleotide adenylyltransferase
MVGLFFGSFNPIHVGHLIIANYLVNYTDLKEVWFVVSPHNPLKKKSGLADMYDRLEMVQLAIENNSQLKASNIEFSLAQPSYTVDTLAFLGERYPEKQFALIMGADNIISLPKWKNFEVLLANYPIYVYPRPGIDIGDWANHPSVKLSQAPILEISSTFIRQAIKAQKNIQFFLPDTVIEFIEKKNLYR